MVWAGRFLKRCIKFLSLSAALVMVIKEGTCSFNHIPVWIFTPPLRLPFAIWFPQAFIIFLNKVIVVESTKKSRERSEDHTSELQSRENLVCRLLLEKKKRR